MRRGAPVRAALIGAAGVVLAALATPAAAAPAERRFVTDEEAALWSGVGLISRADGISCTAVLIRPDVVLTAAHCVADADARTVVSASDLVFGAGVLNGRALEVADARAVEVHPGFFAAGDRYGARRVRVDVARVTLAAPIVSAPAYQVAVTPPAGGEVALLSYARGRVGRVSIQHPCRIVGRETEFLLLDCLSESGASGSPYFVIGRDGQPAVVGINSGRRHRGERSFALALAFAHVMDFIGPSRVARPAPSQGARFRSSAAGASGEGAGGGGGGGGARLPGGVRPGEGLKRLSE